MVHALDEEAALSLLGEVLVFVEGAEYCNATWFAEGDSGSSWYEMEQCKPPMLNGELHASFRDVRIETEKYGDFSCVRDIESSDEDVSLFACDPEGTPNAPTPQPTSTPLPTSALTLAETDNAALWIAIGNWPNGQLRVSISPAFHEFAMHLSVLVEGEEYCNLDEVFDLFDEYYEMACGALAMSHPSVEDVSVLSTSEGVFRCERNFQSQDWVSLFACNPYR